MPQAFSKAATMLDQEKAVEQWDTIDRSWRESPLPGNVVDAKARVATISDYLKANPRSPFLNPLNAYVSYLNQGIAWTADASPWKQDFAKLLANPLIHDLQYLETQSGTRYYVLGQVQVTYSNLNGAIDGESFPAVTSPDLDHPVKIPLPAGNLLKDTTPSASPQTRFAATAQNRIAALDGKNWDSVGFDIIEELRQSAGIHPVLQAILLQHILDINKPVAQMIERPEYDKASAILATKDADDIAWMDPAHPVAENTQNDLRQVIGGLPDLATVQAALRAHRAAMINAWSLNILGEGVLLQPQDGSDPSNWTLNTDTPIQAGEVAYVVNETGLVAVGHVAGGKWAMDGVKLAFVPNGTLVFITPNGSLGNVAE
jgi:hypothetical protein